MKKKTAYTALAPYYDQLMSHVDYARWGAHLKRLLRAHGKHCGRILELGSGTCGFDLDGMFPESPRIIYTDVSESMLRQARKKGGRLAACSVLDLCFRPQFNTCFMLYDAINYLADRKGLLGCLEEVYRVLLPGGVFIFDVTTEFNSMNYFEDEFQFVELPGCAIVRHSTYGKQTKIQENRFVFFMETAPGIFEKKEEKHIQMIFSADEITLAAEKAKFRLLGSYDNMTLSPDRDNSERIHFILEKPADSES